MKQSIIVVSTQRETIYINTTNQELNITNLWLEASKKRYLKLEGVYTSIDSGVIENIQQTAKNTQGIRYFNCISDFLKW